MNNYLFISTVVVQFEQFENETGRISFQLLEMLYVGTSLLF